MWTEPITDRTADDITNRTRKAFFNIADWVRIYGDEQHIQTVIRLMTGQLAPLTILQPPTVATMPTVAAINQLIDNINILRQVGNLPPAAIAALKHNYLDGAGALAPTYTDANAWEHSLQLILDYLVTSTKITVFCGVGNCGQERFWQSRWRLWPGWAANVYDPRRLPRLSFVAGASLLRQNRWRSPCDRRRSARCGCRSFVAGKSFTAQNGFRRYA